MNDERDGQRERERCDNYGDLSLEVLDLSIYPCLEHLSLFKLENIKKIKLDMLGLMNINRFFIIMLMQSSWVAINSFI